jgi:hypothetical protein
VAAKKSQKPEKSAAELVPMFQNYISLYEKNVCG